MMVTVTAQTVQATPTLTELITATASRIARRYRLIPEELANEAHVEIWKATEFSADDIERFLGRIAERLRKREQRQAQRHVPSSTCPSTDSSIPTERVEFEDLKNALWEEPRTHFEREALKVILGEHPSYERISEFAENNGHCSRNHAYRLVSRFRLRLQKKLTSELYGQGEAKCTSTSPSI